MDGDGRKGLVVSGGDGRWDACRSTGRRFACASLQGMPAVVSDAFLVGDFDQDGRDDILIPAPRGRRDGWQLSLSRSAGFECTAFSTPVPSPGRDPGARTDHAAAVPGRRSRPGRCGPPAHARGAMQEQDGGFRLADFKGDGVVDLVFGSHVHGPGGLRGVLEACSVSITSSACRATDVEDQSPFVQVGDVNYYDGTRAVTARTPAWIFHLDSRGVPRNAETWAPPHAGMSADCLQADFDGDGEPDLACHDRATQAWTVSLVGSGDQPDLLRGAIDGNGFAMFYDYAKHDDPTVYERGQGTRFPQVDKLQA